jgi:hypothetical protein
MPQTPSPSHSQHQECVRALTGWRIFDRFNSQQKGGRMSQSVEMLLVRERPRTIIAESPKLYEWLQQNSLKVNPITWTGQASDFPTDKAKLVFCSDFIDLTIRDLKDRCRNCGHVLFRNDQLLDKEGWHKDPDDLIAKVADLFGLG